MWHHVAVLMAGRRFSASWSEGLSGLRYRPLMAIGVSREVLAGMLRQHGEEELADRALSASDDELARIGTLGAHYAWSDDAIGPGGSMGGTRALSLASIDVLEDTGRDLRLSRPEGERRGSSFDRFAESDRELRRHAAERQIPADKSKRTLDVVDPPAWGPAPADASRRTARCHELRIKPLIDFTDDDLGFMIDQGIAVDRLVSLAIERLRPDALTHSDPRPGGLLAIVLRVDAGYWERFPDPDVSLRTITENLEAKLEPELELRELIDAFRRGHSERRQSSWNGLTA